MRDELDDIHALFHGAPRTTEFKKLRKRIVRMTREAIEQYGMNRKRCAVACLLVGRQRQLHIACCASRIAMARSFARRHSGV